MESESVHPARPTAISGVAEYVDPPPALAVVCGAFPTTDVFACLDRLRCDRLQVPADSGIEIASAARAAEVVLLGPDALDGDAGLQLVTDFRRQFPHTRILLLADGSTLPGPTLLTALRAGVHDVVDPVDAITLNSALDQALTDHREHGERVLAIGAHPDDVEIGCGGALLEHRRRGDDLTILTLSHGQVGGPGTLRTGESMLAARSLGARLLLADLPDTRIDPGVDTIRLVEEVIRDVDPSVIYVHSRHDNHQDHRAVHAAVIPAARRVPRIYAYQSPSATNDFDPTKFVPIDTVMTAKVELLSLFATQNERSYLEPDLVIAGARYWARQLAPRARYAEPFEILRTLVTQPGGTRTVSAPAPATVTAIGSMQTIGGTS